MREGVDTVRGWVHRIEQTRMSDDELGKLQKNLNAELQLMHLNDVCYPAKLRRELLNALGGVGHTGVLNTDRFMDILRSRLQEANETLGMSYTAKNLYDPKQVYQTVNRFLKTVGLETAVAGRQQVGGKRVRSYKIDPELQAFLLGILERREAYKERAARERDEQGYHEVMDRAMDFARSEAARQGVPYSGRVSFAHIEEAKQEGRAGW